MARVREALKRGLGKEAVADEVRMEDFQERFGALGVGRDAYRRWLRAAVEQAVDEAGSRPGG